MGLLDKKLKEFTVKDIVKAYAAVMAILLIVLIIVFAGLFICICAVCGGTLYSGF
ncbi:MAG: hypothetical protein WBZ29_17255 [Methanocella sp.]